MWLLAKFLNRVIDGSPLRITDADGHIYQLGAGKAGALRLRFTDSRTRRALCPPPRLGRGRDLYARLTGG